MARLPENDGGLARPGETRRESKDKNPSGKPSMFQQVMLDSRHCCDETTHEIGVLAERQPSPARDGFVKWADRSCTLERLDGRAA
jgi:hypothetical protein